jgi:hypothetical protein
MKLQTDATSIRLNYMSKIFDENEILTRGESK